jgi:hypothetical protein
MSPSSTSTDFMDSSLSRQTRSVQEMSVDVMGGTA